MATQVNDNPYAVGKNVYRGGTPEATSGPVSAQGQVGYAERDMNNPQPQQTQQSTSKPLFTSAVAVGANQALAQSSPTGRITYTPPPGITLDYDLQSDMINAQSNYNSILTGNQARRSAAQQENLVQTRELGQQTEQGYRSNTNTSAYRGMLYSSGYQVGRDRVSENYNNMFAQFANKLMAELQAADASDLDAGNEFQSSMGGIYGEAARRMSQSQQDPENAALDPNYTPGANDYSSDRIDLGSYDAGELPTTPNTSTPSRRPSSNSRRPKNQARPRGGVGRAGSNNNNNPPANRAQGSNNNNNPPANRARPGGGAGQPNKRRNR